MPSALMTTARTGLSPTAAEFVSTIAAATESAVALTAGTKSAITASTPASSSSSGNTARYESAVAERIGKGLTNRQPRDTSRSIWKILRVHVLTMFNLAIGAYTKYPEQALDLVKCATSLQSNIEYMVDSGNPAAKRAAYDDPKVRKAFPMASLIRDSIDDAGPRPVTPYYNDVSTSVQRVWHPATEVRAPQTPEETATFMTDVLQGKRLL